MGKLSDRVRREEALKTEVPADELGEAYDTGKAYALLNNYYALDIALPLPVYEAVKETVERLQGSGLDIDLNRFIQIAVMRELRRREVTWWETRVSKAMRVLSGSRD